MSLLWADGFDHYGSAANIVSMGGYKVMGPNTVAAIDGAARTGPGALRINGGNNVNSCAWLYKSLPQNGRTALGGGVALNVPQSSGFGMAIGKNNGDPQVFCIINNDGSISLYKGDGSKQPYDYDQGRAGYIGATLVGQTDPQVFKFGSYSFLELLLDYQPDAPGALVRVDGTNVLVVQQNLAFQGSELGSVNIGHFIIGTDVLVNCLYDDFTATDDMGQLNVGLLGDVSCQTLFPSQAGPDQTMPANQGDPTQVMANVPYNPGAFLEAGNVGEKANFRVPDLPKNVAYIPGLVLHTTMNKTDSGACSIRAGVVMGGVENDTPAINPGAGIATYSTVMETNPSTGLYLTRDDVDGMMTQVERTA